MPVVECAGCHRKYKVGDDLAGKKVKCKSCGQVMHVPGFGSLSGTGAAIPASARPAPRPDSGPDLDSIFAGGGGGAELHFKDDEDASPAVSAPPPIPSRTNHGSANKPPLPTRATSDDDPPNLMGISEPPPPPISVKQQRGGASRQAVATMNYATPAPAAAATIARTRTSSVHGQPASGLDSVSPLLLLLFFVSGIVAMIVLTMQLKDAPAELREAVPTSAIWTGGFSYMALLFFILGPLTWLAVWITSKIFSFQLGDVPYLRACGVAAIPGIVMFFSPVIERLQNPIVMPIMALASIPLTYFIIRGVFYMSYASAAVAFLFTGLLQGIGQFVSFLIVTVLIVGSIAGAAREKQRLALQEKQQQQLEQIASLGTSNRQSTGSSGSADGGAPSPVVATPKAPELIETIPDAELPVLGEASSLDPARLQHDAFISLFMFRPPKDMTFSDRRGGERPSVTFVGPSRSVSTRSGSTTNVPATSIEATAVLTRETAYQTPQKLQEQSKRAKVSTVAGFPCVATFDVKEQYSERQYVTTYHVFTRDQVLRFEVSAFAPFVEPVHRELALCLHTLKPLDLTAQALGDLKSGDPRLQAIALGRLAEIKPDARKTEVVEAIEPLTRSTDATLRAAAIKTFATWGDEAVVNSLLIVALSDSDRSTRVAAMETLAKRKDERAIEPLGTLLGRDPEAVAALIAFGEKAEPVAIAALERTDATSTGQKAAIEVLAKVGTKEAMPALLKAAASNYDAVASAARSVINRIEPGSLDALAMAVLDLKSGDHRRQGDALLRLSQLPVDDKRKGIVGQALLEVSLDGHGTRADEATKLLTKWAGEDTVVQLIAFMEDEQKNHFARQKAILMLGQFKDPKAVAPLIKIMTSSFHFEDEGRKALILHGSAIEEDMIKLLNVKKDRVRINACAVLAEIGTERSVRPLGAMAAHDDFLVSRAGKDALARLKMRLQAEKR